MLMLFCVSIGQKLLTAGLAWYICAFYMFKAVKKNSMAREIKFDSTKTSKFYFQQRQAIFSTTFGPALGPTHPPN
jgi:hypothetical protein